MLDEVWRNTVAALPVAKLSMTLLSSSTVGSALSSSMIGMHLIAPRAEGVTVFSLEQRSE